jgi:hypothetical protein
LRLLTSIRSTVRLYISGELCFARRGEMLPHAKLSSSGAAKVIPRQVPIPGLETVLVSVLLRLVSQTAGRLRAVRVLQTSGGAELVCSDRGRPKRVEEHRAR